MSESLEDQEYREAIEREQLVDLRQATEIVDREYNWSCAAYRAVWTVYGEDSPEFALAQDAYHKARRVKDEYYRRAYSRAHITGLAYRLEEQLAQMQ